MLSGIFTKTGEREMGLPILLQEGYDFQDLLIFVVEIKPGRIRYGQKTTHHDFS